MTSWNPVRVTPMYHQHLALGAIIVEQHGWQQPARYNSPEQELACLRQHAGLCDLSALGKLSLQGSQLDAVLGNVSAGAGPLESGCVRQQQVNGLPVVLVRLASDEIMILTAPDQAPGVLAALGERQGECAHVVDITSALAGVRLTGPSACQLLAAVGELDASPDAFRNMRCAQGRFAEVQGLLLRQDIGELLSYELYFGREFGQYMWEALLEAGQEYEVRPVGIEAVALLQEVKPI